MLGNTVKGPLKRDNSKEHMMSDPDDINQMIEDAGGSVKEVALLPDGSGFMTASMPLPEDHWIYEENKGNPPMPLRLGTDDVRHAEMKEAIWSAAKYAVRSATMNGKEMDFDPDALCQNMVVGLIGYFTADGTSNEGMFNPDPIPPKMPPFFIKT